MESRVSEVHAGQLKSILRAALRQVFNPKPDVLEELVANSPFFTLAVEHRLKPQFDQPRETYITAQRDCVLAIRDRSLLHQYGNSLLALKEFVRVLDHQMFGAKPKCEMADTTA